MLLKHLSIRYFQCPLLDPSWDEDDSPLFLSLDVTAIETRPAVLPEKALSPSSLIGVCFNEKKPPTERELIKSRMADFPHADPLICDSVAREFLDWGKKNAKAMGIDEDTWLWKRTRCVAGFGFT